MPSKGTKGVKRGFVIPVGGAEDKLNNPTILKRIIKLFGSKKGYAVIIPTASRLEDTGDIYVDLFKKLGIGEAVSIPINERDDCFREDYIDHLNKATGIFITGGNQLRLSTIIGGTPVAKLIRQLNADGIHVAGTSAGAAIMPEHMIAGGKSGSTPKEGGVRLAPGLGLTNALIIDQHFRQRDRLGRLLTALSYNPFATGIGLDEDTAVFIGPDDEFEVVGSGAVTVVDPGKLEYSSMANATNRQPVTLIGMQLHILAEGFGFNTGTRVAKRFSE
jgi:cyanophycinase